ncbi:MAG: hypothetical protein COV70_03740 [Parcubacteria group bacterium CG11_big_fil_rev_8_21_14_0_20_39_22]|nr:MAG: hypothetical protein COV70_03740 [Parcubacteria group bacterium CG11_big_fil_rev_8_21_14_0_20_39_22]
MYIKVDVTTDAKEERFVKKGDDNYAVSVREKPRQNLANRRILELVRENLAAGEKRAEIKIVSGHHSPKKIISLELHI